MNCLDCEEETPAVAMCGRCGAALCRTHLVERDEPLFVTRVINRVVYIDPPARRIRCERCDAAERAQIHARGVAV
jgi:hypothetical protein